MRDDVIYGNVVDIIDDSVSTVVDCTGIVDGTVDCTVGCTVDSVVDSTVDCTVGCTVDCTVGCTVDSVVDCNVDSNVEVVVLVKGETTVDNSSTGTADDFCYKYCRKFYYWYSRGLY